MICFLKKNIWIFWIHFQKTINILKILIRTSLLQRWVLKLSMICWLVWIWMLCLTNCVTVQVTMLHSNVRMRL